ncbi:GH32 C-terminal domain-containing protein [Lactiplantibacillus plantarum]|uniref:GH32 C-terminal domain-containing protein n=1 Tax=Lactiplantibacillus plantarum TaxID=1590 RepID=UPI003F53DED0
MFRGNGNSREHYKMYKVGSSWKYSILFFGSSLLMINGPVLANADTVQPNVASATATSVIQSKSVTSNADSVTPASDASQATSTSDTTSSATPASDPSQATSTSDTTSSATPASDASQATSPSDTTSSATPASDPSQATSTSDTTSSATPVSDAATPTSDADNAASTGNTTSSVTTTDPVKPATSTTEAAPVKTAKSAQAETESAPVTTASEDPATTSNTATVAETTQYNEQYRNQFHYSPAKNWTNDPNGLFYNDQTGEYNLYYQYNPKGNEWGNMSWGHAVSKDMINWKEEPVAIPVLTNQRAEDFVYNNTTGSLAKYGKVHYSGVPTINWNADEPNGEKSIFSGSIYVDKNNISGLGKGAILAYYTAEYQIGARAMDGKDGGLGTSLGLADIQEQQLAYSLDGGKTFIQYSADGNSQSPLPLIPITASKTGDSANFRDPNVIYDPEHKQFLMITVSGQEAQVYTSTNLLQWQYASTIKRQNNLGVGVWECPSLIPMKVAGTNDTKWIFSYSVQQGAHATGSGMQYFVGDLDANGNWVPESSDTLNNPMTFDSGEDFYAGVPFANMNNDRHVMLGWESNWTYDGEAKTTPWYGNMTLPRELTLVKDTAATDGYALENSVIPEVKNNEKANVISAKDSVFKLDSESKLVPYDGTTYKVSGTFTWDPKNAPKSVGFKLRQSGNGQYFMTVGYDLGSNSFFVQRLNTGEPDMGSPRDKMNAHVDAADGKITITVYVDATSIEAFANNDEKSITQNFFMRPENLGVQATNGISAYTDDGVSNLSDLTVNPIESIWHHDDQADTNTGTTTDNQTDANAGTTTDNQTDANTGTTTDNQTDANAGTTTDNQTDVNAGTTTDNQTDVNAGTTTDNQADMHNAGSLNDEPAKANGTSGATSVVAAKTGTQTISTAGTAAATLTNNNAKGNVQKETEALPQTSEAPSASTLWGTLFLTLTSLFSLSAFDKRHQS